VELHWQIIKADNAARNKDKMHFARLLIELQIHG